MGYIYSGSNTTMPIGKVMDYNNTNPSKGVALYRILTTDYEPHLPVSQASSGHSTSFANAIYGGGPYSLLHPNSTTEYLAQNIDTLA